ncbi:MAG: hypothetical protein HY865_16450 [Chloroflexi bacterium]|nr:hypothetical protein [Chloroflexota bacterium]
MTPIFKRISDYPKSVAFMLLLIFFANLWLAAFAVFEHAPSPAFELLYSIAFIWSLGWWLKEDNLKFKEKWIYDIGILIYVGWLIVIPIYLFKTRGALNATKTIFKFIGFYVGTFIMGIIVFLVLKLLVSPYILPPKWQEVFLLSSS